MTLVSASSTEFNSMETAALSIETQSVLSLIKPVIVTPTEQIEVPTEREALVPGTIFEQCPNANFWIGAIAVGEDIKEQSYYDGLMHFRGNVYVRELQFLPTDALDAQGREIDEDDRRSIEFVVIENESDSHQARVVGSARLIVKEGQTKANELPVEHYFPEVFEDKAAANGSVEISRFIARHDGRAQGKIMLSLIRAVTMYSMEHDIDTQYFMIEEKLVRLFNLLKIPQEQIGKPKDVPEYNGFLYPVRLSPHELYRTAMADQTGKVALKNYFEKTASLTGEGFYNSELYSEDFQDD